MSSGICHFFLVVDDFAQQLADVLRERAADAPPSFVEVAVPLHALVVRSVLGFLRGLVASLARVVISVLLTDFSAFIS